MQIIISAVLWDNQLKNGMSQLELIELAVKSGCSGVEFRPYWQNAAQELPLIKQALAEHSLRCTYACNEFLLGSSPESVLESLAAMAKSLAIAKQIGASVLRINVAGGLFERSVIAEKWWREAVQKVIDLAASANIVLALENPPDHSSGDPQLIHNIISAFSSPWLKATFDTGNWLAGGYNPVDALNILGDLIGYVHIKDIAAHSAPFQACEPGAGCIDFGTLVAALKASGYEGLYALEYPGGDDPLGSASASRSRLGN